MGFFTTIVLESLELGLISSFNREDQDPSYLLIMALNVAPVRDTKWLTLEVCRQFQRGTCSRSDEECKFAHPPKSCQVENGRVIACFDSLKVRECVLGSHINATLDCQKEHFSLYFCRSLTIDFQSCFSYLWWLLGDLHSDFFSCQGYINFLQVHV